MRWALGLEYNGGAYHGWQIQPNSSLPTVQGVLEQALSSIADHPIEVICAGRTDRGVHAYGQVVHFDTPVKRTPHAWVSGGNRILPHDVSILWAQPVSEEFHARYTATARRYQYILYLHSVRPALLQGRVTWWHRPLTLSAMQTGANFLLGEHDFSAFRAADCQAKTTLRTLTQLQIKMKHPFMILDLQANAFLHHMVRNIMGVLLEIGMNKRPPEWAKHVLDGRDRRLGGITAPPDGLYLAQIIYPGSFGLPNKTSCSRLCYSDDSIP